jgi:hypothetical protein
LTSSLSRPGTGGERVGITREDSTMSQSIIRARRSGEVRDAYNGRGLFKLSAVTTDAYASFSSRTVEKRHKRTMHEPITMIS